MIDPMKGTPMAAMELPEGVVGLGAGEMAFLLARHETPGGQQSREILMLDPRLAEDAVLLAGASTLVARGWLVAGDGTAGETRSVAALVEYALGNATRWTRLGFVGEGIDAADYAVLVESDTVMALLQPRVYASWFVRLGDADTDRATLVNSLVVERLAASPGTGVILDVRTLDSSANLAVRGSAGAYEALSDVAGPGTGTGGPVDAAELLAKIAELYAQPVGAA